MPAKILYGVLNWGIGHATRSVPVIRRLREAGAEVYLASSGRALKLLQTDFPELETINMPALEMNYGGPGGFSGAMLRQSVKLAAFIRGEHRALEKAVSRYGITGVISDGRPGFYSEKVPSVLINHQMNLKFPFFEKGINKIARTLYRNFSELWIPDTNDDNRLAGDLSVAPEGLNTRHIGWLSRYDGVDPLMPEALRTLTGRPFWLYLLSGPEPHRSRWQEQVVNNLHGSGKRAVVLLGTPGEGVPEVNETLAVYPHLPARAIAALLQQAQGVVARSGYSTLMDLCFFGQKAVLVPTPGQSEQEYLAKYQMEQGRAAAVSQEKFDAEQGVLLTSDFKGFGRVKVVNRLTKVLSTIL